MILSVSRRTDIPAFYSKWFYRRIAEGFVLVKNPVNAKQISRIPLRPDLIDCIVFWTKNPQPMLDELYLLDRYMYYFQFTLNPYDRRLEVNLPDKELLIDIFIALAKRIGKKRMVWRYDPILVTDFCDVDYHIKWFTYLCRRLYLYTEKCVISFYDPYVKTERNLKGIKLIQMGNSGMYEIAFRFSEIAAGYGLKLETCSESIDLKEINIRPGKCIDDQLISGLLGEKLEIGKDPHQRERCGCVKSIDIGEYNTCQHNCVYCYASLNQSLAAGNRLKHDSDSPLLIGQLSEQAKVSERKMRSYRKPLGLFD